MLSILFLYFIGKPFYNLAGEHGKSQWGFAILGILTFYSAAFFLGIILAIVSPDSLETMNDWVITAVAIPLGLLFAWLLYKFLQNRWNNAIKEDFSDSDVLDQNLNN